MSHGFSGLPCERSSDRGTDSIEFLRFVFLERKHCLLHVLNELDHRILFLQCISAHVFSNSIRITTEGFDNLRSQSPTVLGLGSFILCHRPKLPFVVVVSIACKHQETGLSVFRFLMLLPKP